MTPERENQAAEPAGAHGDAQKRNVSRDPLNDRFFGGLNRKLTLVEAPAGYGKTTLMQGWFSQLTRSEKCARWIQVGADTFQTLSLEEQVLQALTDSPAQYDPSSTGSAPVNVDGAVTLQSILGCLAQMPQDTFLFFDDAHECTPHEADVIQTLMLGSGERTHFVIGTRETLGFPLTKMRLDQQINDFGTEDLRLTRLEVAKLLGATVAEETVDAVYEYTEGWVAALQLLRQAGGATHASDLDFSKGLGGQAGISDYLNEHFFARLSEGQQAFLVETAHLGTIDGDLANHLRQTRDSWDMLTGLAGAHSLVFERPGPIPGYRYHQLLRDFLMKRQAMLGEHRVRDLNLRTADWCFENDRLTSAIRHALIAKQPDKAVDLILRAGAVQIGMQKGATRLAACLDQIPIQLVNQTPRLAIARAYLLLKGARLEEAARYLDEVRQTIDPTDEVTRRELVLVDAHKRLYEDQHLTKEQLASLEHTARITPVSDELMRGILTNFLCHFQIQAGNLDKARAYGDAAMAIYTDLNIAHLQFFMHLHLSVVDLDSGAYSAAYKRRNEALRLSESHFRHDPAICALADIYYCEIALETGRPDGLEERLTHALAQAGRAEGWSEAYLSGYETSLALSFANHGYDVAMGRLADAEASATRRASRRFARHLRILELELALDAGHATEAGRLAAQVETMLNVQDHENKLRWRGRVLARLALARHYAAVEEITPAMATLAEVAKDCQKLDLRRYLLRTEVLRVITASGAADWALADESLKSVLALSAPEFPGTLIRHAEAFSQAARDCVLNNGLATYTQDETRKLAQLLWSCSGHNTSGTHTLLSELLTNRENAVVELIARGAANKVIARELDLSEATVKFHIKNVFTKLGVNSRKLVAEIASAHGVSTAHPSHDT